MELVIRRLELRRERLGGSASRLFGIKGARLWPTGCVFLLEASFGGFDDAGG